MGYAVYSRSVLAIYDFLVLGASCRYVWRCPARLIVDFFDLHVSANHLDVGVGTGFFLERCSFPSAKPRLGLMDVNPNCLAAAARRVSRYVPEIYRANVLEPLRLDAAKFDSASLSLLLHCLPAT
jgi:ubiquinone/menaquinone biosynthesis C-methylase UbiE